MKLAVIGSRKLTDVDIDKYVSGEVEEIVSGGAVGVDRCAADYARLKGLKLTEFLPEYEHYGRAAPIVRNKQIRQALFLFQALQQIENLRTHGHVERGHALVANDELRLDRKRTGNTNALSLSA